MLNGQPITLKIIGNIQVVPDIDNPSTLYVKYPIITWGDRVITPREFFKVYLDIPVKAELKDKQPIVDMLVKIREECPDVSLFAQR